MAFDIRDPCPFCNQKDCLTIDSRSTKISRRRRKECQTCNKRHTTHEISEEFFEQAVENQRLISYITEQLKISKNSIVVSKNKTPSVTCDSCISYTKSLGCSFDFPEAGDDFASECSLYASR